MRLPARIRVLERGWLSANNVLLVEGAAATLVDSGYVGHVEQTLALVEHALEGRQLTRLVNTHCHSDHMGGNARIAARHGCPITIPEGEAGSIDRWDERELILGYADQRADRFRYDDLIAPGETIEMGGLEWDVHAAPGHDAGAVVFFSPDEGVLISGDALWQNGFGVVFGALLGNDAACVEARDTLDRIAALDARVVIPGHGAVFADVDDAIERARNRLAHYESSLDKLARHCVKALFTYALLDRRAMPLDAIEDYLGRVPVYVDLNRDFIGLERAAFARWLVADLERAGVVGREGGNLIPRIKA
jgi:glyoxylase-like metal-dependent hydrolase (beta-lactamase superfamily II)